MPLREQRLAERVVDLVRAGVSETVLALELGDVLTAELAEAAARSGIVSGGEDHRTGV
jgi:hypothetical protein